MLLFSQKKFIGFNHLDPKGYKCVSSLKKIGYKLLLRFKKKKPC